MTESITYLVVWTRAGRPEETRTFTDRAQAIAQYEDLVADPKCDAARVIERADREIRAFEREHFASHPPPDQRRPV